MPIQTEIGPPSGGGPRKPEARGRVDIAADGDLAHWLKVFDATHADLLDAIAKVGDDAAEVAAYLKRGSESEPPGTTRLPDGG